MKVVAIPLDFLVNVVEMGCGTSVTWPVVQLAITNDKWPILQPDFDVQGGFNLDIVVTVGACRGHNVWLNPNP